MSYDRIWIEDREHPGKWLERSEAEKNNLSEEFDCHFNRLYGQGHFVVLVAGKNYFCDELFLFEAPTAAQDFYESGFAAWESFPDVEGEGCGFQEVSLYQGGLRIASKSYAPSEWIGVEHE